MTDQTPIRNNEAQSQSRDLGLDLQSYLRVLLKRKWILLACFAFVVTATVLWTLKQPKQYLATASIIIDPKSPEVLGQDVQETIQIGAGQLWWNEAYYRTQVQILSSRKLAFQAVVKNSLAENPDIVGQAAIEKMSVDERLEIATSVLMQAVTIKQEDMNHIFKVKIKHGKPEVAAFLANAYVEAYMEYTLDLRTEGTKKAAVWLTDEMDTAESELNESEQALLEFRRENDILSGSLEDTKSLVQTKIDLYTSELNKATIKVIELGRLRKNVVAAMKKDVLSSPVFALTENEMGPSLKTQYYEDLKTLGGLEESLGEKEPRIIKQKRKVAGLLARLKREANLAERIVLDKHKAAVGVLSDFKEKLEHWRGVAHSLGPKFNLYERHKVKKERDKADYKLVSDRLRSTQLTGKLKTINIRVLDEALVPSTHSFPRMDRNAALATVVSLLLGIGLAFFLEFLDRSIKGIEDVENTVNSAVLGVIPLLSPSEKTQTGADRDLLVHHDPKSRTAECCRQIRTNLLFASADKQFETLVVTSPNPKEGKSTTVLYLATTMAQSGLRVLVVDSDMRRPRLHKAVGVSRTVGLSNLIVGDAEVEDVVISTEVPNLSILPCGPTPPNPAELLMSDSFQAVLKKLEERYDRVIFDSPPLLAVTDALIMSKYTDGTVLVVRSNSTKKEQAFTCAKQLRDVNANLLGVVLNQLDLDDRSYGYYYHYYYGYSSQENAAADAA